MLLMVISWFLPPISMMPKLFFEGRGEKARVFPIDDACHTEGFGIYEDITLRKVVVAIDISRNIRGL